MTEEIGVSSIRSPFIKKNECHAKQSMVDKLKNSDLDSCSEFDSELDKGNKKGSRLLMQRLAQSFPPPRSRVFSPMIQMRGNVASKHIFE